MRSTATSWLATAAPARAGVRSSCSHTWTWCPPGGRTGPSIPSPFSRGTATSTAVARPTTRSEEHTSELQSRLHLVCRLLLEKKKNEKQTTTHLHYSDQPE